jgi:hypothetical protein
MNVHTVGCVTQKKMRLNVKKKKLKNSCCDSSPVFSIDSDKGDKYCLFSDEIFLYDEEMPEDDLYEIWEDYHADEKNIKMKIISTPKTKLLEYVQIPRSMVSYIIKNKITVYCDYMDQGFHEVDVDYNNPTDTFVIDGKNTYIYTGKFTVVNKKYYDMYKKLKN